MKLCSNEATIQVINEIWVVENRIVPTGDQESANVHWGYPIIFAGWL